MQNPGPSASWPVSLPYGAATRSTDRGWRCSFSASPGCGKCLLALSLGKRCSVPTREPGGWQVPPGFFCDQHLQAHARAGVAGGVRTTDDLCPLCSRPRGHSEPRPGVQARIGALGPPSLIFCLGIRPWRPDFPAIRDLEPTESVDCRFGGCRSSNPPRSVIANRRALLSPPPAQVVEAAKLLQNHRKYTLPSGNGLVYLTA